MTIHTRIAAPSQIKPSSRGSRSRVPHHHSLGRRRSGPAWPGETPARAARAFREYFAGYHQDPLAILNKTFDETGGYEEMVVLRGIPFESHCEHHVAPIIGQAWVAYVPSGRVVGLSKLARVVDAYAKRLQIQERMTSEIASAVQEVLKPQGVGVVIKATHHCMSSRGVHKVGADMVTSCMLGCFRDNALTRQEFLAIANQ